MEILTQNWRLRYSFLVTSKMMAKLMQEHVAGTLIDWLLLLVQLLDWILYK